MLSAFSCVQIAIGYATMPSDNIPTTVSKLGSQLVSALPPAFIVLVLAMLFSFSAVIWFESKQADQRLEVMKLVFDACVRPNKAVQ